MQAHYTRIIFGMNIGLTPRQINGGRVTPTASGWRLEMSAGAARTYRLAQLDDYIDRPAISSPHFDDSREVLPRGRFWHAPPWTLTLRVHLSAANLPGTWGFGLWNDPFGLSLGFGGKVMRLPALPQTAWFFHASLPNWLCLHDDPLPGSGRTIPASGFFAGTFRSLPIPSFLLAPGLLALPFFRIRPISRLFRRLAGRIICQDGLGVDVDVTQWHDYSIRWLNESCTFSVDGNEILSTQILPHPPLGLIIWMDNQFAAWAPDGRLGYGTLENPDAWMEIENLTIQRE